MQGRILALDLGDSWVGRAHTDITQTVVTPMDAWKASKLNEEIILYINQYKPIKIIIGLPITMKGKNSQQTEKVIKTKEEIDKLIIEKNYNIETILLDERLSSTFAKNIQIKNNSLNKLKEHSIAASIILQNYLNKKY